MKTMTTEPAYRSDTRPDLAPFEESLGSIHGFDFAGDAGSEIAAGKLTVSAALDLLDDMLAIRELEEMIVRATTTAARRTSRSARRPRPSAPAPRSAPTTTSPAPTAATATQ